MTKKYGLLGWAILLGVLAHTAIAQAQTISFADAATLLAKDCGADVKKFCKGLNLGNGRIQGCLQQHQDKVSPTCTASLASVTASIEQRLAAQANVLKACEGDIARLCKGVKGEVHVLGCLEKTEKINSAKCNQAITDAGWR